MSEEQEVQVISSEGNEGNEQQPKSSSSKADTKTDAAGTSSSAGAVGQSIRSQQRPVSQIYN